MTDYNTYVFIGVIVAVVVTALAMTAFVTVLAVFSFKNGRKYTDKRQNKE